MNQGWGKKKEIFNMMVHPANGRKSKDWYQRSELLPGLSCGYRGARIEIFQHLLGALTKAFIGTAPKLIWDAADTADRLLPATP